MQPEPFGEHKALHHVSLAGCSPVGIIGDTWVVVHATIVGVGGSGRRRGPESSEHRALSFERGVERCEEGDVCIPALPALITGAGIVERMTSFGLVIDRSQYIVSLG